MANVYMKFGGNGEPADSSSSDSSTGGWAELWTNPNPTSNFSAQTVSIDLSAWSFIAIKYARNNNLTGYGMFIVGVDGLTYDSTLVVPNSTNTYKRSATANATGVTFTTGYQNSSTGAAYCIPEAIYGVC